MFDTENFISRLFWSGLNRFCATPYFEVLRLIKVADVDTPKKLITSACYAKLHVCAYLQSFSC